MYASWDSKVTNLVEKTEILLSYVVMLYGTKDQFDDNIFSHRQARRKMNIGRPAASIVNNGKSTGIALGTLLVQLTENFR